METRFTNNYGAIEDEADSLIDLYERKFGPINSLFTPVEIIAEQLLEVRIDLLNLEEDIIGCIDVINKEIYINQSLDPIVNNKMEGRYYFTLSHEIGHLKLHKYLVEDGLITSTGKSNSLFCRTSENKDPIEKQADYFASCLLMPRKKIWQTLGDNYGEIKKLDVINLIAEVNADSNKKREVERQQWWKRCFCNYKISANDILEWWANSLAKNFRVSPVAMVIRLKEIGFIE